MDQSTFSNKCEICGLKVFFDQSSIKTAESVESYFGKLRSLQGKKLAPKGYSRVVSASIGVSPPTDSSEICAINHPSWQKKDKKCKYWQPDLGMSLGEHLALHEAKKMEILTKDIHKLTAIAAFIPVIYLSIEIYKWTSG